MRERLKIAVVGHYERDYPRNAMIRRAMTALGHEVIECHTQVAFPRQHLVLAGKVMRLGRGIDLLWVAEGGHDLVPGLKAVAALRRVPLIFDPFTSRYNTRVEDRAYFQPQSGSAYAAAFQDWSSCRAADHLVFDTAEHRDYFVRRYRLRRPTSVIEIAVDEEVFFIRDAPGNAGTFEVLFYGTYIPLQGVPTIVRAAELLGRTLGVHFTLIGRGQVYDRVRWIVDKCDLANVTLEAPVHPTQLAERIASADLCLGIFGATTKATRVVPNKVVQCAAMGKPIITRDSPAIRRYFRDEASVRLVPPDDPAALAGAVEALLKAPDRRLALGQAAKQVFDQHFCRGVLQKNLQRLFERVVRGP